jgi:phosphate transport system substrate-binding protein
LNCALQPILSLEFRTRPNDDSLEISSPMNQGCVMKADSCNKGLSSRSIRLLKNLAVALVSVALAGCPASRPDSAMVKEGKLVIKGSNTIGEELAPRLIAEFKKDRPKVTVELESKGTASGFAALLAGECDIAAASRVANQEELTGAAARGIQFNLHTLGSYAVAVIVNAANSVTNLSRDQVRDVFGGTVKNWKDVGGADAPIQLCIRDATSGTPLGFQELAMENKPYAAEAKAFTNYAGIAEAVAKEPGGIGYVGFDLTDKAGLKAVSIRGVLPTAVAVNEGRYPVSRVLRLYTNQTNETAITKDFVQFVQSPRGQKILEEMGFVPRL